MIKVLNFNLTDKQYSELIRTSLRIGVDNWNALSNTQRKIIIMKILEK